MKRPRPLAFFNLPLPALDSIRDVRDVAREPADKAPAVAESGVRLDGNDVRTPTGTAD